MFSSMFRRTFLGLALLLVIGAAGWYKYATVEPEFTASSAPAATSTTPMTASNTSTTPTTGTLGVWRAGHEKKVDVTLEVVPLEQTGFAPSNG